MKTFELKLLLVTIFTALLLPACKKILTIPEPVNTITSAEVFADSTNSDAALKGIYNDLINSSTYNVTYGCGSFTVNCGSSADELLPYIPDEFSTNTYMPIGNNSNSTSTFWMPAYAYLYRTNDIIGGVAASKGISATGKTRLIAEAKFLRAYFNFYLVNLYGDIPLVTGINFQTNALLSNSPVKVVYAAIIADLIAAQSGLPDDYSAGGGERIRANKWAATALLARVYLYQSDWVDAQVQSASLIANSVFQLESDLNAVFLKNSSESILQWQINSSLKTTNANITPEGLILIPPDSTYQPNYYLTKGLLQAFEPGDRRFTDWVKTYTYTQDGNTYSYPFKYKLGLIAGEHAANGPVTEYYMVFRLAEQYLIRAEAEANGAPGGTAAAIADLNIIRNRAGLTNLSATLNQTQVLTAVAQERRIELFSEWGHRWFDLKRTNQANAILQKLKPNWASYKLLYPIPQSDIKADPNLRQNPGY
ncbi:MAG: hypothetical protein JWR50_1989 [Mucilaginibacter sp.]|nr:hypothetical protein [Mucilaginibacter sp.]